jgi:predicted RNA-binding Zn ribbon-like protein
MTSAVPNETVAPALLPAAAAICMCLPQVTRYDRIVTVTNSATPAEGIAPGPLELVQSLANTLDEAAGGDLLAAREQAVPWLREAGLMPADAVITGSEHSALLRLRDALRDALAAHATGSADPDSAARLTMGLADGRLVTTITPDGAVKLATAARSIYPSIVAAIAVAIAESDAADTWPRLKLCQDPNCGNVFYEAAAAHCPAHAAGA